jgi:hypothetical protein
MADQGAYKEWTVTMKGSYVRGNKRRKFNFKDRDDEDSHNYTFYGMPDKDDDFYAVKGEKSDLDYIKVSRRNIDKDNDIIKCVGDLEEYMDYNIYVYHKKDGVWPAGLYEIKRYRLGGRRAGDAPAAAEDAPATAGDAPATAGDAPATAEDAPAAAEDAPATAGDAPATAEDA